MAAAALLPCLLAACASHSTQSTSKRTVRVHRAAVHSQRSPSAIHPHAVQPVAGAPAPEGTGTPASAPAQASAGSTVGGLAQPTSLAQVRAQLAASGLSASLNRATLAPDGLALAPVTAPAAVQQIINAGNQIAHLPYRFGGGHGTYEDSAYDCSGSLSFVLAAAGLLNTTVTSGQLMQWGQAGPGKWVTIFASPGHTFMYVAGIRFDTVALAETGTRWSNRSANEPDLSSFAVRHPPGL